MKNFSFILIFFSLFLFSCSSKSESLLHEEFKKDVDQMIEMLSKVNEEGRALNENEEKLFNNFYDKYIPGKFIDNKGNEYEMNDLEKEITRQIDSLTLFTKENLSLASEKTLFEKSKDQIKKLINSKEIPSDLKDKYPTYERYDGVHPQFLKDTKSMLMLLRTLIETGSIDQYTLTNLENYIKQYQQDGFLAEDGTHYLMNNEMKDMYMVIYSIHLDVESGKLYPYTEERYYELVEKLNLNKE